MALLLAATATIAGGLFAGAAVYITLVEHPARVSCGAAVALAQFRPSYARATVMQASLAVVGALAAFAHWATAGGAGWIVGGVLLGSVVPLTLIVILPTNHRLVDPALDASSPETGALLARWGRLHALRSIVSLAAFVLFVGSLARG